MLTAEQADLAAAYFDLAESQAWNFVTKSGGKMDIDDAKSAAMFGLCQALGTWESYCQRNSFDPSRTDYQRAYLLKRIRGSILDAARSADHMTRSDRVKTKAIRAAEDAGARTDAELAAATGLSVATVRRLEADALMPCSLDDHLEVTEHSGIADHGASVESQAVVSGILAAFLAAFDRLDPEVQVILALRYHGAELDFGKIAEVMFCGVDRVRALHDAGILAVHQALVTQADTAA